MCVPHWLSLLLIQQALSHAPLERLEQESSPRLNDTPIILLWRSYQFTHKAGCAANCLRMNRMRMASSRQILCSELLASSVTCYRCADLL
jgi:hypothetical protein